MDDRQHCSKPLPNANTCISEMQLVCETGRTQNVCAVLETEENVMTAAAGGHSRMAGKLAPPAEVGR
jgi:hypothetical protein